MKFLKYLTLIILVAVAITAITGCSCRSWNNLWGNGSAEPAEAMFWDKECKVIEAKTPVKKVVSPKPSMETSSIVYPCTGCGILKVEKTMPDQVVLGKEFDYFITVTNLTDNAIADVKLVENLADNFKFISATPNAKLDGRTLLWDMKTLAAGDSQKVRVTGLASTDKTLKHCTNATYKLPACDTTKVVQPKLMLTRQAPAEVLQCDMIPITYTVKNSGTGSTDAVTITEQLPAGLSLNNGKTMVSIVVGPLAAGQSKAFKVMAKSAKTGAYSSKAAAKSKDGLTAQSQVGKTMVKKPVLAITKTGKASQYIGRKVTYNLKVTNTGDATAADAVLEDMVPVGTKFVSATSGGKLVGNKVVWQLGDIKPGGSVAGSVTYMPTKLGTITNNAQVNADCAAVAKATAKTTVRGIAAILLEVIDVSDPVEIGSQTTYRITVTNQGSAADTNISLVCTIEDAMAYVTSSGKTSASYDNGVIKFVPLSKLSAKAKATWTVTTKAVKAADSRFKVVLNSDNLGRTVQETEATKVYE